MHAPKHRETRSATSEASLAVRPPSAPNSTLHLSAPPVLPPPQRDASWSEPPLEFTHAQQPSPRFSSTTTRRPAKSNEIAIGCYASLIGHMTHLRSLLVHRLVCVRIHLLPAPPVVQIEVVLLIVVSTAHRRQQSQTLANAPCCRGRTAAVGSTPHIASAHKPCSQSPSSEPPPPSHCGTCVCSAG